MRQTFAIEFGPVEQDGSLETLPNYSIFQQMIRTFRVKR